MIVRRVVTLADWWIDHRGTFVSAWSTLLGKANPAGEWPPSSLEGMIRKLEEASERGRAT